jgi:peptidoglycan/xylan/chitin deacetylase (PgdA/CDA1 family)
MPVNARGSDIPAASRSGHRLRWLHSRKSHWGLATLVAAVLMVGMFAGVTWGRAHLTGTFQPSDNQLATSLAPGQGPFATWLASDSTLAVGEQPGRHLSFSLPARRTGRLQLPPLPAPRALGPAPVIYFGPAGGGAFYITIDDGKVPDSDVLALMQSAHIPITAFLTSIWAAPHLDYWKRFQAAGGDIEDHTVSHPDLTRLNEAADRAQWVGAAQECRTWFRKSPTLGRPPFGTFNRNVQIAAGEAGLRYVVLWSASMYNGKLTTYDHGPLRAGEIVILHWIPGVYKSLVRLLQIASAQGLHPASLLASLG